MTWRPLLSPLDPDWGPASEQGWSLQRNWLERQGGWEGEQCNGVRERRRRKGMRFATYILLMNVICFAYSKPLVSVHHMEAHALTPRIEHE